MTALTDLFSLIHRFFFRYGMRRLRYTVRASYCVVIGAGADVLPPEIRVLPKDLLTLFAVRTNRAAPMAPFAKVRPHEEKFLRPKRVRRETAILFLRYNSKTQVRVSTRPFYIFRERERRLPQCYKRGSLRRDAPRGK